MTKSTLMLIENERQALVSLQGALRGEYSITTAASGEEAIELMKKLNIDLILLDIRLPGMSGLTALRIIKTIDDQIPVIIVSDCSTIDSIVQGFRCGACDFFYKPFSIGDLKASIATAIRAGGHRGGRGYGPLSVDMEDLIHDTLDSTLKRGAGLRSALQRFRERYIDLVEQKMLRL